MERIKVEFPGTHHEKDLLRSVGTVRKLTERESKWSFLAHIMRKTY